MNQLSSVPFGTDATVLAGYAQHANASLGNLDITIENTGSNTLTFQLKEFTGTGVPSGYANIGGTVSVVPKGVKTVSYNLVSKRVGFFGSGNTVANISLSYRNKGDIRGAQIDLVATGRRGWGFDRAFNKAELTKKWGSPPDSPSDPSEAQQTGGIGL
jgi:hypothetical protein